MEILTRDRRAPDLLGFHWFNSEPVSIQYNRGSVILLQFWDYTHNESLRSLECLKAWQEVYEPFGLILVGIHAPKYQFSQNIENVEQILRKLKIRFPVVMDNDSSIWSAFQIRKYPTLLLIDRDGFVRYLHEGDGGCDKFERAIQILITETGLRGEMPDYVSPIEEYHMFGNVRLQTTNEIELGYLGGNMGNTEGYNPHSIVEYNDPGMFLPNRFYLNGKWLYEREYVQFKGEKSESGYITIEYRGHGVNVVLSSSSTGLASKIEILLDNAPLRQEESGIDVQFEKNGASYVLVDSPRMYQIIRHKEFGRHTLLLRTNSEEVEFYSFSFQTTQIPAIIHPN